MGLIARNHDDVKIAYRKLKQWVYYDKTNLTLRHRLAEFEHKSPLGPRLDTLATIIHNGPTIHDEFRSWLSNIKCIVIPKTLRKERKPSGGSDNDKADAPCSEERFITNLTSAPEYQVEKVNYFFDAPIELYLIDIVWLMRQGYMLDRELGRNCHGSRLAQEVGKADDRSSNLFKKYHEQYSQWRDGAIRTSHRILVEEQRNIHLLGLDVQEYYYHINLDFEDLRTHLGEAASNQKAAKEHIRGESELLGCIREMHTTFRSKIAPYLQQTHESGLSELAGIPIGLPSSPVFANWYLREFDTQIQEIVHPAYYGRYIDDILLVIASGEQRVSDSVQEFMQRTFVRPRLIKATDSGGTTERYEIDPPGRLYLKLDKCTLQYFDARHSVAGLVKFQKQLDENASHFALLPIEEEENSLEEVAYDLLYDGSVNKFRSVKGLAENRLEVAKYLARRSVAHLYSNDDFDNRSALDLEQFFRGRTAIEFHMDWERVFAYYVAAQAPQSARERFEQLLLEEIKRVRHSSTRVAQQMRHYLRTHLEHSRAISEALEPATSIDSSDSGNPDNVWRSSNLIRHHLVAIPLLNYMEYKGSLVRPDRNQLVKLRPRAADYSPRFVRFDECMLFAISGMVEELQQGVSQQQEFAWAKKLYEVDLGHMSVEDVTYTSPIDLADGKEHTDGAI